MNNSFIREVVVNSLDKTKYYSQIPSIKSLTELDLSTPITFFMGENGSGKSTLLEAIAVCSGFNPEGGSFNFNFKTYETHSDFYKDIKLIKGFRKPSDGFFLRAESFYNVSSYINEIYENEIKQGFGLDFYGGNPHERSHGQAFLGLVLNKFRNNGLYILDEPEAALSPQNQLAFMARIHELAENGAQFIIATHSPIITALPNSKIYNFSDTIEEITYDDSDSYKVTKLMIEEPKRLLYNLLEK